MSLEISLVIPSYGRAALLRRLLERLQLQTLAPERFEVVVVDDGSPEPLPAQLEPLRPPYRLRVVRKPNGGAASARNAGARIADGAHLVFLDDDMQVEAPFLARHLAHQRAAKRAVVLGRIAPDPALRRMPLFERWYARLLDRLAEGARSGALELRGHHLFTGNVSLPRGEFLAAGGFDETLPHSEDVELGLRLEKQGCVFRFAYDAPSLHGSDHTEVAKFLRRAFLYGQCDTRIGRKHPDLPHASPWRMLTSMSPVAAPLLTGALVAPALAQAAPAALMAAAAACDRTGLERPAHALTSLAYGVQYARGVRAEMGSLPVTARDFAGWRWPTPRPTRAGEARC